MEWTCPNGHIVWRWSSQPTVKYRMQAGDFMLATNILLSGSNYSKVALLFKFNMGMVDSSTFYTIQDTYCVDTIKEVWNDKRAEIVHRLQNRDVVIVAADGRMDSPGHCAQYCTYTAMENDSREIISIITIDKRETQRNSVIMEKEAFIQTVDMLLTEVKLVEVCTDAHVQISALMSGFWGAASMSTWKVMGQSSGLSTADLESFQNHILMYASKRSSFTPPAFEARTLLAALDYNYHKDRPDMINPDGSKQYKRKYQKNSRRYSLYTVKVKKTYGHIPDLQARILRKRLTSKGMPRRRSLRLDDPRRFGLLPLVPAPTIDELRQSQIRRGFGRWKTPVLLVFSRKKK
ncbi:hypothetical protein DPX16_14618 [Anabarilius grahami]|uniref:Uncharacterized protein n=1 Tax=Anabarilius grahami TaxID=495550 RepID=A0A3N0YXQ1_ANAGA|nr:hypothetical protein DPX16_14618 [Anabarilius grahami]